jgi:hypothetical protein
MLQVGATGIQGKEEENMNKGASLSVIDVDCCIIIIKLLDTALNILPTFICRRDIQRYLYRNFPP